MSATIKEVFLGEVNSVVLSELNKLNKPLLEGKSNTAKIINEISAKIDSCEDFIGYESKELREAVIKLELYDKLGLEGSKEWLDMLFECAENVLSNDIISENYYNYGGVNPYYANMNYMPYGMMSTGVYNLTNTDKQDDENPEIAKNLAANAGILTGIEALRYKQYKNAINGGKRLPKAKGFGQKLGSKATEKVVEKASSGSVKLLELLSKYFPRVGKLIPKVANVGVKAARVGLVGATFGFWIIVEIVMALASYGAYRFLKNNGPKAKIYTKKLIDWYRRGGKFAGILDAVWNFFGYYDIKNAILKKGIALGYISEEEAQEIENSSNLFGEKYANTYNDNNNVNENMDNNLELLRKIIKESLSEPTLTSEGKAGGVKKAIQQVFKPSKAGGMAKKRFNVFGRSFNYVKKAKGLLRSGEEFALKSGNYKGTVLKLEGEKLFAKNAAGKFVEVTDKKLIRSANQALRNYERYLASFRSTRNGGIRNVVGAALVAAGIVASPNLLNKIDDGGGQTSTDNKEGQLPVTTTEPGSVTKVGSGNNETAKRVKLLQMKLIDAGYYLGNYGQQGDGVDGILGPMTKQCAIAAGVDIQAWLNGNVTQAIKEKRMSNRQLNRSEEIYGVTPQQTTQRILNKSAEDSNKQLQNDLMLQREKDLASAAGRIKGTSDGVAATYEKNPMTPRDVEKMRKKEKRQQMKQDRQNKRDAKKEARKGNLEENVLNEAVKKYNDLYKRMEEL